MAQDYWQRKLAGIQANYLFNLRQNQARGLPTPLPGTTQVLMQQVANGSMSMGDASNEYRQREAIRNTVKFASFPPGKVPEAPAGFQWVRDFSAEPIGQLIPYKLVRLKESTNPFGG